MKDSLASLLRKRVEVSARGGITYKGLFVEANESELYLKCETGWVTVPMERVISVKEEGAEDTEWKNKDVDPTFFRHK